MLKIYKISQIVNNYNTYDSAVVVAETAEDAKRIYPGKNFLCSDEDWVEPENVIVEHLANVPSDITLQAGDVICASFKTI